MLSKLNKFPKYQSMFQTNHINMIAHMNIVLVLKIKKKALMAKTNQLVQEI